MTQPLLELTNVTKQFPYRAGAMRGVAGWVKAVNGVTLAVPEGAIVGLVGESGCGKTTLAKLIAQLEPPTSGTIHYRGQLLTNGHRPDPAVRREIQLVFQDPTSSLNPRQRVGSALSEPLIVHRLATSAAQRAQAVDHLLDQVGLPAGYARRYPRELSGGERQRVAIARALMNSPRLVLADEPTGNLDEHTGDSVIDLLLGLCAETGTALVLVTHNTAHAAKAGRRLLLRQGRLE